MRRAFRKDLLITSLAEIKNNPQTEKKKVPKKRGRKRKPIEKNEKRRSKSFERLMKKYIDQIGQKWSSEQLASLCGVSTSTVYKWSIGYKPHNLLWRPIARYIAKNIKKPVEEIYIKLEKSLTL